MRSDDDDLTPLLAGSQLLAGCPRDVIVALSRHTRRRELDEGERLWEAGDAATHLAVIVRGLAKVVAGKDILGLFGPRESIGDVAALKGGRFPAAVVAASPRVEVLLVEAAPLREAMRTDAAVASALTTSLVEHAQRLREKIAIRAAGSVQQRLAALFSQLAERFGDEMEDGLTRVPVSLSREELGELVGARVETVIREMSRWQKEGVLDTSPEGFTLRDEARLRALLSDES